MAVKFLLSLSVLSCLSFFVLGEITLACNQTPYPAVCNSLIPETVSTNLEETRFSFRDGALKGTMSQATQALRLVSAMDLSSFDKRAKLAWADCLELYRDTIEHLNRSIESWNDPLSAQTWLSATIANERTCRSGFMDFKLSSYLEYFPPMLLEFSKMLSNSLYINKAAALYSKQGGSSRRLLADIGFPSWVSAADRKLLQAPGGAIRADVVVAGDGSGNYKTISEAVAAATKLGGGKRFVIHVKAGVYRENVDIKKTVKELMIVGDGIDATIVTGNRNVQDGSTTFRSATFAVMGDGFIARDITFENTAGPQKHQAVAFRSGSDLSVLYRCGFKGYQDTVYAYSQRQFYRDCDIYGTQDFIFGDAASIFQNCNIYVRKPLSNQKNTITAQGRTDPNENTGIVIHNSRVTAAADLRPVQGSYDTYLGRPWQKYSRTVFLKCTLDGLIDPAGWLPWSGSFALSTLYYGEYMNTGAGASTGGRVKWPGYHVMTSVDAGKFTAGSFLAGDSWIPATGAPYTSGL